MITKNDFRQFDDAQGAFECFTSHRSRGFTVATAMVVCIVLYGRETYGRDACDALKDWIECNTRGTDVGSYGVVSIGAGIHE